MDNYDVCKNVLTNLLSTEQSGSSRYLFAIDQNELAEVIFASGCNAVLVRDERELSEITELLSAVDTDISGITLITCCTMRVNKLLANAAKNKRVILRGAYALYGSKKLYYVSHPDELGERIKSLIDSLENTSGTVVRDTNSGLILTSTKSNSFKTVAEYLIEAYDIVKLSDEVFIHKTGRIYTPLTPDIADSIAIRELHNSVSGYRRELFNYITVFAPVHKRTKNCIPFINCVYNIAKGDTEEFTDEMYFTSCVPHRFSLEDVDKKYSDLVDKFFDDISCGDEEVRGLILDMLSYCLVEGNKWQKTFICYGDGCNGKGVLFKVLERILGSANVTYRNWTELTTTTGRFGIVGKQLILCNDIDNIYLKQVQALKTLTACEPQTIKQLYRDEFTTTFRGKIITACNSIPRVNDTSNGWGRRVIIIPFDGNFTGREDPSLAAKLSLEPCMEYLVALCVIRLQRVLDEGFTPSKRVNSLLKEYKLENNPILQFIYEYKENFKGESNAKTLEMIYTNMYMSFCKANNYKPYSKIGFAKRINSAGMKWQYMKGTNTKVYFAP